MTGGTSLDLLVADGAGPDDTLVFGDIGIIGYYSRMRVVDTFGLVVRRPDDVVRAGTWEVVRREKPEYFIANRVTYGRSGPPDDILAEYVEVARFEHPRFTDAGLLHLYRRRDVAGEHPALAQPQGATQGARASDLERGATTRRPSKERNANPAGRPNVERR